MYYLLRLEVQEKIEAGLAVVDFGDISFPLVKRGEANLNHSGLLWDGQSAFGKLSSKYKDGDVLERDIFDISFSYFSVDERGLGDWLWNDIYDLFEHDLIEYWQDMSKPIVFLMSISSYVCHTEIGDEYEVENVSVNVVTQADFAKLEIKQHG